MIASGKKPLSRPVARYFAYTNLCHLFLMPISIFFVRKLGFAVLSVTKINEDLPTTADQSNVRVGFSVGTAARATVLAR